MNKQHIGLGILLLMIVSGVVYVQQGDTLKIRVDKDKTTFYVKNENNRWIVSGREYNKLYNGTRRLNRDLKGCVVNYSFNLDDNISQINRTTVYKKGAVIIDSYSFDGNIEAVEMFPISHSVQIINGSGLIYQYEVRNIAYDGDTIKNVGSPIEVGNNMKIEWQDDVSYWNTIYKSGIFKARFRVKSDDELFLVRLYDPATLKLYIDNTSASFTAELGTIFNITANDSDTETVCVDIDHPDYGVNYSCGTNTVNFTLNISYHRTNSLNNSNESQNLSYGADSALNHTIYIEAHQHDLVDNMTLNLTGFVYNGTYPKNITIYINESLSNDIGSIYNLSIVDITEFNDSSTVITVNAKNSTDKSTYYFKIPKRANVSSAYLNLTTVYEIYNLANVTGATKAFGVHFNDSYLFYGSNYFIDPIIYKMHLNGTIIETFTSPFYDATPIRSITGNDTTFFTVDSTAKAIYVADSSFNYLANMSLSALGFTFPFSVEYNDTYLWIVDKPQALVRKITVRGDPTPVNFSTSASKCTAPEFITFDGDNFWITDSTSDELCKFMANGTYDKRFDTAGMGSAVPYGLTSNISENNVSTIWMNDFDDNLIYHLETRYPNGVWLDVAVVNSTHDIYSAGYYFGINNRTNNMNWEFNDYLVNCSDDDDGYCYIPTTVYLVTRGSVNVSDVDINYTYDKVEVSLNITLIERYLANSNGYTEIPIVIENAQNGTIEISDISYLYAGGNKSYEIKAHNVTYTNNVSYNVTYYFSYWNESLPRYVNYLEFIPTSSYADNVTPYGQTSTTPIYNVSWFNYADKNASLYLSVNESYSCVDLYASSTNSKPISELYTGLVLYAPFDYNGTDVSGKGNDATRINNSEEAEGLKGKSRDFDFSEYNTIEFGNLVDFQAKNNFTVSFWFNKDSGSYNAWKNMVTKGRYYTSHGWMVGHYTSGLELWIGKGTGALNDVYILNSYESAGLTNGSYAVGTWYMATARVNNSDGDTWAYLFKDGTLIRNESIGAMDISNASSSNYPLCMGSGEYLCRGQSMDTKIDEVYMWNRSLSDAEISSHYSRTSSKYYDVKMTNKSQLIAYDNTYLNTSPVYMWADYECNFTQWKLWYPEISIVACCDDCDKCDFE